MRSLWDAFAMALILAGLVVFAGVSHACEVRGPVAGAEGFGRGHAVGAPLRGLVAGYVFCMRDVMSQEIAYQAATATKSEANVVTSARRIAASLLNLLEALTDHQIQDIRQLLEGRYEEEGRTWQQLKTDAYAIADALSRPWRSSS